MFLIFVTDMGNGSMTNSYLYVDDAKLLHDINSVNDIISCQEELEKYYTWARENNMVYNDSKFVLLRYGNNSTLKDDYIYFTDNMSQPIDCCDYQKDLGVYMSADGTFNYHIETIIKKAKQKIGWICRTFQTRELHFMKKMFTTYVRPYLNYCSQLWSPGEGPWLDKLEKVQYNFTKLIPSIRDLDYSDRLARLNLSSIQRRYDRYKIFYIKKILNNLVPNVGISVCHDREHRNGLSLEVMGNNVNKLRKNSFQFTGPRIFNLLPKDIRNHNGSMETFKILLDNFLSTVPDIPRLNQGSSLHSNTLEYQLNIWRWTIGR